MRYFSLMVLFFGSLLAFQPKAEAQHHSAVPVAIHCACDDAVGRAYIEAVKAALNNKPAYRQVGFERSGDAGVLSINVISMPVESADGKPKSVLSIVCLHDGSIVHQFIETCDQMPLEECAKSMVEGLQQVL